MECWEQVSEANLGSYRIRTRRMRAETGWVYIVEHFEPGSTIPHLSSSSFVPDLERMARSLVEIADRLEKEREG